MVEKGIFSIIPVVLTFFGLILDLVSLKRSSKIIRAIEICESVNMKTIKEMIIHISNLYKNEFEKSLLAMLSYNNKINPISIKQPNIDIKTETIKEIRCTYKTQDKLERSYYRIKIYRWSFCILFLLALINIIFIYLFKISITYILQFLLSIIPIIFLFSLILNLINTNNNIDKVRRKYGIPF